MNDGGADVRHTEQFALIFAYDPPGNFPEPTPPVILPDFHRAA
jgi:hypothetical protein